MPPECVNYLTTSSALALVYDERPLAHTVLYINEANQLQSDENSIFSMLLRSLISEGRIVHQTTWIRTRLQVDVWSELYGKAQ